MRMMHKKPKYHEITSDWILPRPFFLGKCVFDDETELSNSENRSKSN